MLEVLCQLFWLSTVKCWEWQCNPYSSGFILQAEDNTFWSSFVNLLLTMSAGSLCWHSCIHIYSRVDYGRKTYYFNFVLMDCVCRVAQLSFRHCHQQLRNLPNPVNRLKVQLLKRRRKRWVIILENKLNFFLSFTYLVWCEHPDTVWATALNSHCPCFSFVHSATGSSAYEVRGIGDILLTCTCIEQFCAVADDCWLTHA